MIDEKLEKALCRILCGTTPSECESRNIDGCTLTPSIEQVFLASGYVQVKPAGEGEPPNWEEMPCYGLNRNRWQYIEWCKSQCQKCPLRQQVGLSPESEER